MFVFLMNKVLYAPILGIIETRRAIIDDNYKSAQNNDVKSAELSAEKEEKLSLAKDEARGKYVEAVDEFKAKRTETISEAQNSAKDELETSRIELENISNETKNALKGSMSELASDIVEKVIGYRSEIQGFDDETVNRVLWEK